MKKKIWGTLESFIEGGDILGRKVANKEFLLALLTADPFDEYHFFLASSDSCTTCLAFLSEQFPAIARRNGFRATLRAYLHHSLQQVSYHCFHLSDSVERHTAVVTLRNAYAKNLFPVTSVTHSLSYKTFYTSFLEHLWQGTSSRDAIVCTSACARQVVHAAFDALSNSYALTGHANAPRQNYASGQSNVPGKEGSPRQEGFPGQNAPPGPTEAHATTDRADCDERHTTFCPVTKWKRPHLPCIPLGVTLPETSATNPAANKACLDRMRQKIGLHTDNSPLIFLCLARLSIHSKMDFLPVIAACKRAEALGLSPASYRLVLAGWVDGDSAVPEALCALAASRGITLVVISCPTQEERDALYVLADVFISPSDNIQETFGLTLLEAGAAGLPVIASEFDGYRDTIIDGVTGILVPTLGFADTEETNTLASAWMDSQYHLKLAQQVVVDVPAMAEAMARLGTDPALRQQMGKAAQARVQAQFTWDRIIEQYLSLWDTLATTPLTVEEETALRTARHPQCMDFAGLFKNHFSAVLDTATASAMTVCRTRMGEAMYQRAFPHLPYAGLDSMIDKETLHHLLFITRRPANAATVLTLLTQHMKQSHQESVMPDRFHAEQASFLLLWCLKHDHLEVVRPGCMQA